MENFNNDSITVSCLKKKFEQGGKIQAVLNGINMNIIRGKAYAITGVSGSGKSTLLHIIGGLDEPTDGMVLFQGHDIFNNSKKAYILNKFIGFVFQFHYLIKELNVIENVMMPGLICGKSKKDCFEWAKSLVSSIGLEDKLFSCPNQLSGGEQQRVAIARAMFNKPLFVLADEPTGNLDEDNADMVVKFFLKAQREWNMGLVICSHDRSVYDKMDTVYVLHNGQLDIASGDGVHSS
jgi:lipoprotein-releasing system ATP-binding protein